MSQYLLENNAFVGPMAFYEKVAPTNIGDRPIHSCPTCAQPISMLEWLPPYRVRLRRGQQRREPGDIVFGPTGFLVSHRFVDVWRGSSLAGIDEFRSVAVVKGTELFLPRFPSPRARLDFSRVRIDETAPSNCQRCSTGRKWTCLFGLIVDPETCKGLDLFELLNLSGTVMASERFKLVVEREGLTNVVLTPAAEVWIDNRGGQDENAVRARLGMAPKGD